LPNQNPVEFVFGFVASAVLFECILEVNVSLVHPSPVRYAIGQNDGAHSPMPLSCFTSHDVLHDVVRPRDQLPPRRQLQILQLALIISTLVVSFGVVQCRIAVTVPFIRVRDVAYNAARTYLTAVTNFDSIAREEAGIAVIALLLGLRIEPQAPSVFSPA